MFEQRTHKKAFIDEIRKLHDRNQRSYQIKEDFYDPGNMDFLEQVDGIYNENTGEFTIRFESKGTRYDGRTQIIEKVDLNERIHVIRDSKNKYNPNNFILYTDRKWDVGNMPAELCNVIAPLYDSDCIKFSSAKVSYIEPISKRNKHAKQAILFVQLDGNMS